MPRVNISNQIGASSTSYFKSPSSKVANTASLNNDSVTSSSTTTSTSLKALNAEYNAALAVFNDATLTEAYSSLFPSSRNDNFEKTSSKQSEMSIPRSSLSPSKETKATEDENKNNYENISERAKLIKLFRRCNAACQTLEKVENTPGFLQKLHNNYSNNNNMNSSASRIHMALNSMQHNPMFQLPHSKQVMVKGLSIRPRTLSNYTKILPQKNTSTIGTNGHHSIQTSQSSYSTTIERTMNPPSKMKPPKSALNFLAALNAQNPSSTNNNNNNNSSNSQTSHNSTSSPTTSPLSNRKRKLSASSTFKSLPTASPLKIPTLMNSNNNNNDIKKAKLQRAKSNESSGSATTNTSNNSKNDDTTTVEILSSTSQNIPSADTNEERTSRENDKSTRVTRSSAVHDTSNNNNNNFATRSQNDSHVKKYDFGDFVYVKYKDGKIYRGVVCDYFEKQSSSIQNGSNSTTSTNMNNNIKETRRSTRVADKQSVDISCYSIEFEDGEVIHGILPDDVIDSVDEESTDDED